MQIVIEGESAAILARLVEHGRYASPQEAVEDALRQADGEQQRKLAWLRAAVQEALDEGGEWTMEEVDQHIEAMLQQIEKDLP